jgi:predicted TIM-barrel fold metal-dependent hydrolase
MEEGSIGEKVSFIAPADACDSHFHIFGPAEKYPYGSDLRYAPPEAPWNSYQELATLLGISRFVLVQPSAYGRDNRCMLDVMQTLDKNSCRGVVDIDENITDLEILKMNALGVRGVRINVSPIFPLTPGLADKMIPRIEKLEKRCQEIGWHLDFLLPGWLTAELLPVMRRLTIPFSMAHLGMNLAKDGVDAPGFKALLELINYGNRLAYVKLTGIYRMSKVPQFIDADPLAKALIACAPDRIIWGSDYPHLSFAEHSSVELFNLLGRWTSDEHIRKLILADNPARLFGF